jgi:hypothetical protein
MTRAQLEHIIRAAAAITDSREIMVVGGVGPGGRSR